MNLTPLRYLVLVPQRPHFFVHKYLIWVIIATTNIPSQNIALDTGVTETSPTHTAR